jgi:hypothetical protein
VHIWGIHLKNKGIIFNVDNQAGVAIINKKSSKSNRVMTLVRNLVSLSLQLYPGQQLGMQNLIDREETVSHEGILFWHPNIFLGDWLAL